MYKFVTIYRRVDDDDQLEAFFSGAHLPLAEQLPGLLRSELSRVHGQPGGESRFHLMYELYFESRQSYQAAMFTETGRQLIAALMPWWEAKIITWFEAEAFEEETGGEPVAPAG